MDLYSENSNLLSLYIKLKAVLVDVTNDGELREMCAITNKYAYSDQKEMVRVATVKSVARVLNKLKSLDGQTNMNDLFKSIILLLHDEHPEIRSYLVQCKGMSMFTNSDQFSIQSESLASTWKIVDLNE